MKTHFHGDLRALRAIDRSPTVALLAPEASVFEAMLNGWQMQQRSRGLNARTISGRIAVITNFRDHSGKPPWEWNAQDVEEFLAGRDRPPRSISTMRKYHESIKTFCSYLTDPNYEWGPTCLNHFNNIPTQVCLPWNTVRHSAQNEASGKRRPFSYDELQTFFDTADAKVDHLASSGRKGALAALRDSQMFKTAYVFGLRRAELVHLDLADLHHNYQTPMWGQYASLFVRWGKAAGGGAPRRRTVLLVPEFDWWVDGMQQWVETARARFDPRDEPAIWVTERRSRVSLGYVDRRFSDLRSEAGLPSELSLHSLRHSYVTHLIEHGYADRFVQEQVGHQHSSTTAIYASVSGDFKNRVLANALRRFTDKETND